jgi:hypothetical protein
MMEFRHWSLDIRHYFVIDQFAIRHLLGHFPLTAFFKLIPGTNAGAFDSPMEIFSPV